MLRSIIDISHDFSGFIHLSFITPTTTSIMLSLLSANFSKPLNLKISKRWFLKPNRKRAATTKPKYVSHVLKYEWYKIKCLLLWRILSVIICSALIQLIRRVSSLLYLSLSLFLGLYLLLPTPILHWSIISFSEHLFIFLEKPSMSISITLSWSMKHILIFLFIKFYTNELT